MAVGDRGGHIRSVQEARSLQEVHKAEWSAAIRLSITNTLIARGEWHADDLVALGVPAEHLNCIGAQVSALVNRGHMVETGRRRAAAAASNGRKSGIFTITEKGRRELVGPAAGAPSPRATQPAAGRARGPSSTPDRIPVSPPDYSHPPAEGMRLVADYSGARSCWYWERVPGWGERQERMAA